MVGEPNTNTCRDLRVVMFFPHLRFDLFFNGRGGWDLSLYSVYANRRLHVWCCSCRYLHTVSS